MGLNIFSADMHQQTKRNVQYMPKNDVNGEGHKKFESTNIALKKERKKISNKEVSKLQLSRTIVTERATNSTFPPPLKLHNITRQTNPYQSPFESNFFISKIKKLIKFNNKRQEFELKVEFANLRNS